MIIIYVWLCIIEIVIKKTKILSINYDKVIQYQYLFTKIVFFYVVSRAKNWRTKVSKIDSKLRIKEHQDFIGKFYDLIGILKRIK